jgi:signal peptidase I
MPYQMSGETPVPSPESVSQIDLGLLARPSGPRRWLQQLSQALLIAVLAFAAYLGITHFFLQSVRVVGISMDPTLHDSQRYLLNRWVFYLRSPRREDIVVLRDPTDQGFAVKRVVGMPGDSVDLKGGCIYVNGRKLDEPYLRPGTPTFTTLGKNEQWFQCAADQYFVLGDNRNRSIDSRAYGPIRRANILGLIVR